MPERPLARPIQRAVARCIPQVAVSVPYPMDQKGVRAGAVQAGGVPAEQRPPEGGLFTWS